MKNLRILTATLLVSILSFTSCQDEIDTENGDRPNTNSAASPTANNLERTAMFDGSFDDFLDGVSCSSILLPVTATVNGSEVNILTEADYQLVLNIIGSVVGDNDTVELQFPFSVKLSNYTEVEVTNQTEYDAIIDACEQAEIAGEAAINCLDIDFPITILTYSLNLDQTGSVVLNSDEELFTFMNEFSENELFSLNYPITATLNNDAVVTLTSDLDLRTSVSECTANDEIMAEAEEDAATLEAILVDTMFKVESYVSSGVDTANDYADYTIDFANDLTIMAENQVDATAQDVEGTYTVASGMEVFLSLDFTSNASFQLLNNTWEVTSFSSTSISLKSTTNAAITLVLSEI